MAFLKRWFQKKGNKKEGREAGFGENHQCSIKDDIARPKENRSYH